ncbi:MAG: hypothetical protein WAN32_15005, partial [Candidatus Acidiferrum sp.]
ILGKRISRLAAPQEWSEGSLLASPMLPTNGFRFPAAVARPAADGMANGCPYRRGATLTAANEIGYFFSGLGWI